MGRRTLREYCASEGLDLARAIEALRKAGLEADEEKTLREIAGDGLIWDIRRILDEIR